MFLYFQIFNHRKKLLRTNSRSHELVPKIRRLRLQHTKSRTRAKNQAVVFATHELTKSRARAKNQAVVFATHELTKSRVRAKNQVVVFAAYECTNSQTNDIKKKMRRLCLLHQRTKSRYFQKKGCWVCLLQLTNSRKVKKIKLHEFVTWSQNVFTISLFSKCTSHELTN